MISLLYSKAYMNNIIRFLLTLITLIFMGAAPILAEELIQNNNNGMIIRISEIEIYPQYLSEYLNYAKEVAEKSVEYEEGVISIYPMTIIRNNTQIRILEIYKDKEAYEKHIASSHFKKYKKSTLHMVKHLDLVDTYQLSPDNFKKIFKKSAID